MTPSELKEIEQAATLGDWFAKQAGVLSDPDSGFICRTTKSIRAEKLSHRVDIKDAKLIAVSRNILPLLIELWEANSQWDLLYPDYVQGLTAGFGLEDCWNRRNAALKALEEFKP